MRKELFAEKIKRMWTIASVMGVLAAAGGWAIAAQDKYTVKVPGGLAFSEFRGYEAWQLSLSVRTTAVWLRFSPIL